VVIAVGVRSETNWEKRVFCSSFICPTTPPPHHPKIQLRQRLQLAATNAGFWGWIQWKKHQIRGQRADCPPVPAYI